MREGNGQVSAALISSRPGTGLDLQEMRGRAPTGRAGGGRPFLPPDGQHLRLDPGADGSVAGAAAWVTAELTQRTSPWGAWAPRSSSSSVRGPQRWPRGSRLADGQGAAFQDFLQGEVLGPRTAPDELGPEGCRERLPPTASDYEVEARGYPRIEMGSSSEFARLPFLLRPRQKLFF